MQTHPELSIVVPVYNEENCIPAFLERIKPILAATQKTYELLFINDGSRDNTLPLLKKYAAADERIKILALSRNFGKEAAVTAGLSYASGAAVVPIDVDLQDPPEVLLEFVRKWEEGFDVVLGIRADRRKDSFIKRITSKSFYNLFNRIASHPIHPGCGDFRLMSRRVVNELLRLDERDRFMKGLFSWVGFPTCEVPFSRCERTQGKTKWNYWRLFNFALSGICSFSTLPLRVWTYIGFFVAFISFVFSIIIICKKVFYGDPVTGYPSMMASILFLGGVQLIGLGTIGEYIGRILKESKRRPIFIVSETVNCQMKITSGD